MQASPRSLLGTMPFRNSLPVPIKPLFHITAEEQSSPEENGPRHTVIQRLVTPHPHFPEASIETVWEALPDSSVSHSGNYMRIAIYSGPDQKQRVLHSSHQLPPDADAQIYDATLPKSSSNSMAWATFPQFPLHPVLCVLVNSTSLCIWDVYPADSRTRAIEDSNIMLTIPSEGWTVALPFECCAILPISERGLLLQRLEYAEDRRAAAQHQLPPQHDMDGFFLKSPPIKSSLQKKHEPPSTIHSSPATSHNMSLPSPVPSFFSLEHPLEDVLPVCRLAPSIDGIPSDNSTFPITDVNEKLLWMGTAEWVDPGVDYFSRRLHKQTLVVTYHTVQQQHTVWAVSDAPPPPPPVPLYKQTDSSNAASNASMMLVAEDMDLLGFRPQPEPASRQEALAEALGVAPRKSPRKAIEAVSASRSTRQAPPSQHDSFLSPAAANRSTHTAATTSFDHHPHHHHNHPLTPPAANAAPVVRSHIVGSPLHARMALQSMHRQHSTRAAESVFLMSNASTSGTLLLALLLPGSTSDTKRLTVWELEVSSSALSRVKPTTITLHCRDALPVQWCSIPSCFWPHGETQKKMATDLLVHTLEGGLVWYRAGFPVTECAVSTSKDDPLTVVGIRDSFGDRLSILTSMKQQRLILQGKITLCALRQDELAKRMLDCLDAGVLGKVTVNDPSALICCKLRADSVRLMVKTGSTPFEALCAILRNLIQPQWKTKPDQTSTARPNAWEHLQASVVHKSRYSNLFKQAQGTANGDLCSQVAHMGSLSEHHLRDLPFNGFTACLFDHLHLLYEDLKVSSSKQILVSQLGHFLVDVCQCSPDVKDVNTRRFLEYYSLDLGTDVLSTEIRDSSASSLGEPISSLSDAFEVPSIFKWCDCIINRTKPEEAAAYGFQCYAQQFIPRRTQSLLFILETLFQDAPNRDQAVVEALLEEGYGNEQEIWETFPPGIAHPILEALERCRYDERSLSDPTWSKAKLIGREDVCRNISLQDKSKARPISTGIASTDTMTPSHPYIDDTLFQDIDNDGLVPLEKSSALLFPEDNRIHEAARLVRSSRPTFLRVARAVEVSDHDYERLKQKRLLSLSYRNLSLSVGRGMLTIGGLWPVPAEPLPIPELCLKGKVPPTNAGITLDIRDCPKDLRVWPEFHNGVAAGLRLPSKDQLGDDTTSISRTWISYNKPPSYTESTTDGSEQNQDLLFRSHAHGGLLLALGLRGHLATLEMSDLYDYLTQGTATITVGVLLGIAANRRGSCDMAVSRMLCLHIPSLIPQHFSAIDVASSVQAAAVTGAGLLFQRSSHRMMTEFLLEEIGKRPDSDASAFDRESYTLACGIALGMVNLCISESSGGIDRAAGVADLRIEERLHKYVVGGIDAEEEGRTKESNDRFSMPLPQGNGDTEKCSTIFESELINTEITSPGATIALGLMYMKSGNKAIASALALPDTHFLLEFVRPDFLGLRVISRGLVLWDELDPTIEWIEQQVPAVVLRDYQKMAEVAKKAGEGLFPVANDLRGMDFDRRAVRQAYVHTVAGACFAMGLRFAGTGNKEAKKAVQFFVLDLCSLRESRDAVATALKPELPILETALGTAAISLAMILAGTGDLEALKIFKMLRWRCDEEDRYGFHMLCGMAIGLLFLGGGSCTLGRRPEDIAALMVAFFPRFPMSTSDNQGHLQAARHLYALAVRHRKLQAVDVDTMGPTRVTATLGSNETVVAPCLLRNTDAPEITLRVTSPEFYPSTVQFDDSRGTIFVKRRQVQHVRSLFLQDDDDDKAKDTKRLQLSHWRPVQMNAWSLWNIRLLRSYYQQRHIDDPSLSSLLVSVEQALFKDYNDAAALIFYEC